MMRLFFLRLLVLVIFVAGCSEELLPPVARIDMETGGATPGPDGGASGDESLFSVPIGYRVTLDGSGSSDPGGQPLSYRWRLASLPPGSHAVIEAPDATVTWVSPDVAGDYVIELVVSDGALTSLPTVAQFTAGPCGANTPSVVKVSAESSTPVAGDAVLLSATVADVDLNKACNGTEHFSYAWALTELPKGSRATLNDATLERPSLLTDEPGTYRVELVVTDALGHVSNRADVAIEASGCSVPTPNVASVSASPKSPSTFERVQLSAAVSSRGSGSASGADGGASKPAPSACGDPHFVYHWTLVSVPAGSTASLADSPLEAPSFLPDVPGDYTAELFVTNDLGRRSGTKSVTVTASACGSRAPSATAVEATPVSPAIGQAVLLSATVTDPDTSPPCAATERFGYAWALTKLPAGSRAELNDPSLVTPSFRVDIAGTYEATVVVADAVGHVSAPKSVSVVASACGGNAPVVSGLTATPSAPNTGAMVVLDATPTDADVAPPCNLVDKIGLSWALRAVPVGSRAVLSGSSQDSPWFLADQPGTYTVDVEAVDSKGLRSATKTLSVDVSACGSATPVIGALSADPAAPNTGDAVTLAATVSDADTNVVCGKKESFVLTWGLVSVPVGSSAVLSGIHQASPWFSADVPGAYTVEAEVSDSAGHASAAKRATIHVASCGSAAPIVSAIAAEPAAPTAGKTISLSASVADSDVGGCGQAASFDYAWALTRVPAGSAAVLSGTTTPLSGFLADVPGTYTVVLTVTDPDGHTSAARAQNVAVAAASTCGSAAPVARLSGISAQACPPLSTCSPATITPNVTSPPNAAPPNYVVRLNGHPSVRLDASASFDADGLPPCNATTPLAFAWSILAAPVGSAASWSIGTGATTQMIAPTFEPDLPGVYQVGLVVSDGERASQLLVVQIVL